MVITECFNLFTNNNIKIKEVEDNFEQDIKFVDLDTFKGKYILWTELSEKENRISDGSSILWEILGLDKLRDEWANFYKYL